MLAEIEKLKHGEFDENLMKAVLANKKLNMLRGLSSNRNRTEMMKDAFINGESLAACRGATRPYVEDH